MERRAGGTPIGTTTAGADRPGCLVPMRDPVRLETAIGTTSPSPQEIDRLLATSRRAEGGATRSHEGPAAGGGLRRERGRRHSARTVDVAPPNHRMIANSAFMFKTDTAKIRTSAAPTSYKSRVPKPTPLRSRSFS